MYLEINRAIAYIVDMKVNPKGSDFNLLMPYSHSMRNIRELSQVEKKKFLDSFDIVFCDCDGVIWEAITHKPIQAVGQGIKSLKEHGKKVVFITNNSTRTEQDYSELFKAAELEIDAKDIVHPVRSIIEYLHDIQFDGLIYCMGTGIFINALKDAGFKVIDGPNRLIDGFMDLAKNVFDKEPVRAVIMDVDVNLSVPKIIRADIYLRHPACILIGGAADLKIPIGRESTIGPGAYLRIIEESSQRKALTFGKPGRDLMLHLKKQYSIEEPKRILFIGDTLETDIIFGKLGGFQTLLVLTGSTTKENFKDITHENETPDYYTESVADFAELVNTCMDI